ncbi:MAG: peptidylprolyl isomerase [Gammaproteobacteria bacterium]|uniref:Peptidyl-prolyl cis-trans isomerase n=1 Tax=SAR86 cluster bacterium TaxID=2030880 RepID=A0A520MXR1_9GAMM|nr:hypothetical protein [Gammaproteobacteria bacterium]MBA4730108.1 peptidyl-prolyl cis-trans isomerase [SAR86 cluster bacterium]RZO26012.1 MAG: peptidyl-prolyl cis-trans isomerase [SAR86 cluster bacterium]|tara:strand:+ start:68 stop:649 length:582 start_codon:yes stop_codon:yes gene_type:complete
MKNIYILISLVILGFLIYVFNKGETMPKVKLTTSVGEIVIELDSENAPISTENFLSYVDSGFYNGTIFHRVIFNFMIQGGGLLEDMSSKDQKLEAILNEADNGLLNERGTIAMARTSSPHSATSQFFINHVDNGFLNYRGNQSDQDWGYAVFGKVVEGIEVVDNIAGVETSASPPHQDVPVEAVVLVKAERLD